MKYLNVILLFFCGCSFESSEEADALRFQPFSTSVIAVNFVTAPSDTVYLEARTINMIPHEGHRSELIPVMDKGSYFLKLTNDRPASAFLSFSGESHNIIIFPNDTVRVSVKASESGMDISFSGKGADINEYYITKKNTLGYADIRMPFNSDLSSSSTYASIRQKTDSIVNNELNFLKEYTAQKELPGWFVSYEEAEIKYAGLSFMTIIPKYNEVFNVFQDELTDQYYSFLEGVTVNNLKAINSSSYLSFLDNYFIIDLPNDDIKNLSGFYRREKIHKHILPQSRSRLSDEVKELFHKYMFSSIIQYLPDTSMIDSLARVYEVKNYENLLATAGTKAKDKLVALNLLRGDTIPNFYVANLSDSLVSLRDYQDKVLYVNFWATWCGPCIQNIPELNEMIRTYGGQDQIAFLNVCLDSEKEKWLALVERYQLSGINLFAEGKWNEKLKAIFNIKGIPNYVLVEQGNVLYENHTNKAPSVKSIIDKLLGKNTPPQRATSMFMKAK